VNLSGGGAMIAATIVPNLGERLHLHLGADGTVESVVRWVKSGRIGLEFAHETHLDCADEERAELLLDAIDRAFPNRRTGGPAAKPVTDDDSDQRIATRHPLIWSAEVQTRSGNLRVRIRNISATGALIQCTKPLPLGREVILDLGKGGTVDATAGRPLYRHPAARLEGGGTRRRGRPACGTIGR